MQTIRVAIIEDEPLAAERLIRQLARISPGAQVVAVLDSVATALAWFEKESSPDLVLSDVQLGDGISFQIFERALITCPIIFTTSYDEYAIRAFRHQSLDYLLKPVKDEHLREAWSKFLTYKTKQQEPWIDFQLKIREMMGSMQIPPIPKHKERFIVKKGDQLVPVAAADIAFFLTRNDWVCLFSHQNDQYLIEHNLDELMQLLDPKQFFRLNRQCIASATAIRKAYIHLNGKLKIELMPHPDEEVFVSREKSSAFKNWWEGLA